MLKKHALIKSILDIGIVAIIRAESVESAEKAVEACIEGGLSAVELTFTVSGAPRLIEKLHSRIRHSCVLGAGTVLDSETARIAILSGASYIVSPNFDVSTALLCNRYAVPYMAGCYTPTEAVRAMEYGVEIIKLFPSSLHSPNIIKAFTAPLPQANIMPTGGVNLSNAKQWIAAGAVALGVGGDLTSGVKTGDFALVKEKALAYKKAVKEAREK